MSSQHFPSKPYQVLVIDPPWQYYGDYPGKWGAASKFYQTMTEEAIAALPIASWMEPRSVAFIWATGPRMDAAIGMIDSWGLRYRGLAFVWVKTRRDGKPIGAQGVRPSIVKPTTEFVLAASLVAKGRPLPLADEGVPQVVLAPKGAHSQKPEEVQHRIERLFPTTSKAELFARRRRIGWDCFGDELDTWKGGAAHG